MLQQMQIYQPSCSADAVTTMLNWLCNQSDATKTSVLTAMQNGQTSNYFQSIVNLAPKAATAMAAVGAAQAQARQAGPIPSFRPTPEPPDGGYGCHDDDYAMGFAAVALSVLAVSVGGFAGIGGVLAGEYWGSVLGWGTVGAGVWAGVHLSLC